MSLKLLIDRSILVRNYLRKITFDDQYLESQGYWLCSACPQTAKTNQLFMAHKPNCPFAYETRFQEHQEIIYVTGPNDQGLESPFLLKDFKKIKLAAETAFHFQIVARVLTRLAAGLKSSRVTLYSKL